MKTRWMWINPCLALSLAACGGDDGAPDEVTPEEDACEHMQEGPSEAATAIDDMTADAPDVGEHHTRWDISLVDDGSGMYSGYVDLVVEEEGESLVFLDADVPLSVWDAGGDEVTAEASSTDIDACAEVQSSHTFDLGVGTYLVSLGPTSSSEVSVVVVLAGEHEHED